MVGLKDIAIVPSSQICAVTGKNVEYIDKEIFHLDYEESNGVPFTDKNAIVIGGEKFWYDLFYVKEAWEELFHTDHEEFINGCTTYLPTKGPGPALFRNETMGITFMLAPKIEDVKK